MSFKVVETKDGSPSLQLFTEDFVASEIMHHSGGAYSETQYIYGEALRLGFSQGLSRVVSVGLGLGYNEILSAHEALEAGVSLQLESYESESALKAAFLRFIFENQGEVYQKMSLFFPNSLRAQKSLQQMQAHSSWILREALTLETLPKSKPQVILYDAFSGKTTPELWEKDFLIHFLNTCDQDAIFTTYACRASLKKALKEQGFKVLIRPGFQGKRNCTLAIRGRIHFKSLG